MPQRLKYRSYDGEQHRYERRTKTPEQALAALMRLCSRAEKSSGDAMRLMSGWGVEPDARPGVLAKLIASKFIDDNRYAEAYVREKTSLAGWGVYKIRRSLAAKGVSKEIIENTLSQLDRNSQKERLSTMLAKKMKGIKAAGDYEMKGKLMRYGMSQGYEYDDVISAVEEVMRSK